MAYKEMTEYWKEHGIEPVQQVVVAAACFLSHCQPILVGARHWDSVMRGQFAGIEGRSAIPSGAWKQGFIDQFGTFLTREEAMQIAKAAGQKIDINRGCGGNDKKLYSEGLY